MKEILKIKAIKTKKGIYIDLINSYTFNSYLFDGKKAEKTFVSGWFKIDKIPKIVERILAQPNINHRYELIDKSMLSDKIPDTFKREDIAVYSEEACDWLWLDKYKHLSSLYSLRSDLVPPINVKVDFEIEIILELNHIEKWNGFDYPIQGCWNRDKQDHNINHITTYDIIHQGLDKILFPALVLPQRKSALSSHQVYKILRYYIRTHIDNAYAKITSDHDFCFAVRKRICLAEEEEYLVNLNYWKRTKRKKIETRYKKERLVDVFEMTYNPYNYQGYTPIKEIVGENIEDLKKKIDKLCKETIADINKPLIDCPHCKGCGVILENKSKMIIAQKI